MSPTPDPRLERAVTLVLRVGVVLSSTFILAGMVVSLLSRSTRQADAAALPALRRGTLHPAALAHYDSVSGVLHGFGHGTGPALVMVGVLLLVATPVVRVAASLAIFAFLRDRRFVVITALVLAVLVGSFALG